MKKHILALAAFIGMTGTMMAQTDSPNRMLIIDQNGQYKGFNIENLSRAEFVTVEGEVAADIEIVSSSRTKLTVNVTRTPDCESFLFNIIPGVMARQLEASPSSAAGYMEYLQSPTYNADFSGGEVSGIELEYDTEYAVATVGIDSYGVACDFRAAYFTTEKAPVQGSPKVDVQVINAGLTTIDLRFTPNADTKEYYFCIFGEGEAQEQFEMWGPMMGLTSMGQMIKQFCGEARTTAIDYQYKSMSPNTKYELYVQPVDKNGNMADLQIFPMETAKQGGSGAAYVDITLGDYKLADWYGEMKPSQFVTYSPNDQTWCYRFGVYLASEYDSDPEGYKSDVASEPPMSGMANWFFYEPLTTDYQINENSEVVIIAAAKNADGVWGETNVFRFTTAQTANSASAMPKVASINGPAKIAARFAPKAAGNRPGFAPVPNKIVLK